MPESPHVKKRSAAAGAALLLSPWIYRLLEVAGIVGDISDVGGWILGMPPELLLAMLLWLAATAGLGLVLYSFTEPLGYLARRLEQRRRLRRRLTEVSQWIVGEQFQALSTLSNGGALGFKRPPPPPLLEFVVEVTELPDGGALIPGVSEYTLNHLTIWKLNPKLLRITRKLIAEREAKKAAEPPATPQSPKPE